jgi:hypothetical protein
MEGLVHIHSGLRWIALILLVVAIFNAIASKRKGEYSKKDKMINLFAMIMLHTQLLIGIILMFTSSKVNYSNPNGWMKSPVNRFFGMEHIALMIIALVIVTIGRKKAEKITAPIQKHSKIATWYLIGLILILASIPWPFRAALGGKWF